MGRFKDRDEVQEFVERQIDPLVIAGLEDCEDAKRTMVPMMTALDKAIREEDVDTAKLKARLLEPEIKFAQQALVSLAQASAQIDVLVSDRGDEVTAELKAMQPKLKKVAEGKRLLEDLIRRAESLTTQTGELATKTARGERAALARWSIIMASQRSSCGQVARYAKEARVDLQRAAAAVQARDQVALAKIGRTVSGYANDLRRVSFDDIRTVIQDFMKEYQASRFGSELSTQFQRESRELGELSARAKPALLEILRIDDEIRRMGIEPPDPAAIVKMLGVPPKLQGEVKNALRLNESGLTKALDSIGKQAGMKTTGRDMVAKLKREKML